MAQRISEAQNYKHNIVLQVVYVIHIARDFVALSLEFFAYYLQKRHQRGIKKAPQMQQKGTDNTPTIF